MENQYIISDISKLLDIEPHVLRYWEEELNLNISRNKLGHRYYTDEDLKVLKKVKMLKQQGLQLKAIKIVLETKNNIIVNNAVENSSLQIAASVQTQPQINDKLKQFQEFMKSVFQSSLKETNEALLEDIKTEIKSNMKEMIINQEVLEEKHYRKLDETIREIQKARQETAVTEKKGWFSIKKKDKSIE